MKLLSLLCACVVLVAGVFVLAAPPPAGEKPEPASPKPSDEVKTLAKDSNEFATDLYKQLATKQGNLFFSPGSIYPALGMLYNGARGDTAKEMTRTMHLSLPADKLNPAFAEQAKLLNPPEPAPAEAGEKPKERPYQLSIANALWAQEGYKFNPDYLALTGKFFGAELTAVDYKTAAEPAREKINAWVEKKTNDKIKDLIPQGALTPDTRLVLTNAIYFKGNWAEPFKKENTKDAQAERPNAAGPGSEGADDEPHRAIRLHEGEGLRRRRAAVCRR
jgi:serpin B